MVRGKTQMKRIEKASSRQVTFSKRRNGLLKKAYELSVLCDAEVALIVFSTSGKLYEFSSSSTVINKTIERYQKNAKSSTITVGRRTIEENIQDLKDETAELQMKIELLQDSERRLLGQCLDSCSTNELDKLEQQLQRSLSNIRARKNTLFREQIEQLKQQEKNLMKENTELRQKCEMVDLQLSIIPQVVQVQPTARTIEVETALFI
ncbi:hypothetical protein ACP275_01G088400 [Erythranthe tilingii]